MEDKIGLYAHPAYEKWADSFEDKYQMLDMVMNGNPDFTKNKTKNKDGRHCIFCNKGYTNTTFENAAHLMPHMIGNTSLYSTFECDACNNKFSLLETDLASYLGVGRSITSLSEDKKAPGFPGIGLEAKSITFRGKKLMIIHKENAERNAEDGIVKLKYQKPTYTPSNVYKLFLKCALSLLPTNEVKTHYQLALEYLRGGKVLGGAHINIFRFPLSVNMPLHVYIFKKKSVTDKLPVYVISFYFSNNIITLPVLLHLNDLKYMNQSIEIPAAPPYFIYGSDLDKIVPSFSTQDLSSPLKLKFEPEVVSMQFNKSNLENTSKFDPLTGEITKSPYNPSGSKYFIATERGVSFYKEELKELLVLIEQEFSA